MIHFTRADAASGSTDLVTGSETALATAQEAFSTNHCVKVPGFLAGDLLSEILAQIRQEDFYERAQEGLGSEACLEQNSPIPALLWLLINDDRVFRVIEAVTGCPPIGSFYGRVYRFTDSPRHHDDWHDDLGDNRLVALSVNLSSHPYEGGLLQIRDAVSGEIRHEATNTGPGDALIFRIAPELQHCVSKVTGDQPKTAFAGWFKSSPDFKSLLGLNPTSPPPPQSSA
jgi:hypothetical protein